MRKYKMRAAWVLIIFGAVLLLGSAVCLIQYGNVQNELLEEEHALPYAVSDSRTEEETLPAQLPEPEVSEVAAELKTPEPEPQNQQTAERENYASGDILLEIPHIKVKAAVVAGTTPQMLKKGPGLYEKSPLPGQEEGNVCIAGHRTTYGAWFRHLDRLQQGDDIFLHFHGKKYVYKVEKVFIVGRKEWSVTEATGSSAVTLTACHPPGSARQRIVARGKLDRVDELAEK